ncbi:MAG: EAL domain-containing protein [Lachnospiraceae bacterium]|nr:EAL domain-containing protein [Lachnospiraceae bacterium]
MKTWYLLSLFALTAALFSISLAAHRVKGRMMRALFALCLTIIVMNFSYIIAVLSNDESLVLLFHGIYTASYIWMLVAFLHLLGIYAQVKVLTPRLLFLFSILPFADTVSLLLNTFLKHAFTFRDEVYVDGFTYHMLQSDTPWYHFHLGLSYVYAFGIAVILTQRLIFTQSVYRRRYIILLGIFLAILVLDAIYLVVPTPLDMNLFTYVVMGFLLYYFIGVYIPRDLVVRVVSYASGSVNSGIVCFDDQEHLIYANPVAYQMLGFRREDPAFEDRFRKLFIVHDLADRSEAGWIDIQETTHGKHFLQFQYSAIQDDDRHRIGSYYMILDKTDETLAYDRERERATHDPLTGIYNMDGFCERVEEILTADPVTPRFMIATNIREFKLLNDLFGLEKGNEILRSIANMLKGLCAEDEVCGRLSSDRFVLLLERDHFNEEQMRTSLYRLGSLINSTAYRLCVHVGIFAIDDPSMTVPQMYDRAYVAINSVKQEGASRIVYYSHQMMQHSRDEQKILNSISQALDQGDLKIYLQPQVDSGGTIRGAEALVRWIHTECGIILPAHFIHVLEEAGLIHQLDMSVWEMACRILASWRGTPREGLYLSVNISPRDFYYIDIFKTLTGLVEKYGLLPEKLHLEITETALMADSEKQHTTVKRLRNYGFQVEIDDFGSGYSSLSMLKDLPVDTLKIDMEFLHETENRSRSRTILESILQMSSALGMNVICEGVENKAQFDFLKSIGCNLYQGYYFSKPVPVKDFEAMYSGDLYSSSRSAYLSINAE